MEFRTGQSLKSGRIDVKTDTMFLARSTCKCITMRGNNVDRSEWSNADDLSIAIERSLPLRLYGEVDND
jgi:hypothetical protein